MRPYPPEDAHGAGPCHYQEIIRTISLLIRLFAPNGQLLAQTYEHLDCDIPLNKYPMRLGRRSGVKWFAQVHNTLAVAGLDSQPSVYESCAVLPDRTCPHVHVCFYDNETALIEKKVIVYHFWRSLSPGTCRTCPEKHSVSTTDIQGRSQILHHFCPGMGLKLGVFGFLP